MRVCTEGEKDARAAGDICSTSPQIVCTRLSQWSAGTFTFCSEFNQQRRLPLIPSCTDTTYTWFYYLKYGTTKAVETYNSLGRLLNMLCRHTETHPTHTHTEQMQAALQRRSIAGHLKWTTKRTRLNIQSLCHSLIFTMNILFLYCASLQLYKCMMGNMNIPHEKSEANMLIKKQSLQGLGWEHC